MAIHEKPTYATVRNNTAASWWNDDGLRRSMIHIFVLYTTLYTLGYDAVLLNGIQAITPWQIFFERPTGTKLGLISASFYLPKVILPFIAPTVADRYGRKVPLYIGIVLMLAGSIYGGLSRGTADFVGARILVGAGTSLGTLVSLTMVPELAHPRLRHKAGAFLWTTFFIGSIFAAWLTFGMTYYPDPSSNNAWRIPIFLQGIGPALLACGAYFLPQSPRWLIMVGREQEGLAILAKYHANGDETDELVLLEMREIKTAIEIERRSGAGSWASWFSNRAMTRRLGVICLLGIAGQCSGNGVVSYYLVPILKQVGISAPPQTAGINGGLSIWSWFFAMSGAYAVERVGRRKLFLTSFAGMFFAFVIITGLAGGYVTTGKAPLGIAVVPFLFMFNAFYGLAQTPLPPLYVPEISPLSMRTKSVAMLSFVQSSMGVFNQFVNPIGLANLSYKYYGVYAALLATFFVLFYFFVRETKGLTIEEAAMVYESEETRQAAIEEERALRNQTFEDAVDEKAVSEERIEAKV